MPEALRIDFNRPLPLFPLPNCVLLPGATVPLHVFEPRYRTMVGHVLDAHGLIAMAVFAGDDWKKQYEGAPPLRAHVCVGYVVRHHRHDDGRYDLLLQGVCRASIAQECPHTPYRQALLIPTEPRPVAEPELAEQRRRFEALLRDPVLSELAAVSAITNWFDEDIPTALLIDLGIMSMCDSLEDRYGMLAEEDVSRRFAFLEKRLHQTKHTLEVARRFRPRQTEDGITLN